MAAAAPTHAHPPRPLTTPTPASPPIPRRPTAPRSVLALDVGRRRIGLAGCDALGICVSPLPALRRGRFPDDLEQIKRLVSQRRVLALVVGLPLDAQQQPTEQALHCRRYGERLARALALPLAWVNEYASSWAAAELHGLHGDRSGALDSAAAALLLQQWLQEGPEPAPVRDNAVSDAVRGAVGSPEGALKGASDKAADRAAVVPPIGATPRSAESALRHSEEV